MKKRNYKLLVKLETTIIVIFVILFVIMGMSNGNNNENSFVELATSINQVNDSNKEYILRYIDNEEYTPSQLASMINSLETRVNGLTNSALQTEISNLIDRNNNNNVFLKLYPVGSIYITNSNTNPGSIFGGTWEAFGAGRTLVGVDASQTEFNTVEKIAGSKTITLEMYNLPSRTLVSIYNDTGVSKRTSGVSWGEITVDARYYGTCMYDANAAGVYTAGYARPITTLSPYITVYMWKRTA